MPGDLNDLGRKLDEASAKSAPPKTSPSEDAKNVSVGMKAGTELVGCVIVGAVLGYLLDGWLETKPVFLIIMLLLGVISGFYNIWRITENMGSAVGFSQLHKRKKPAKTPADKGESE